MRIGDLATATGASVRSLRYYEEQGLLRPVRSSGGHRRFAEDAADCVWLIQSFLAAGLSSTSIRAILPSVDTGVATAEVLAVLGAERERVTRQLDALADARGRLDDIIASATGGCQRPQPRSA